MASPSRSKQASSLNESRLFIFRAQVTSLPVWRETHRDELNHGYFDIKGTETLHTSYFLHTFV